MLITKQVIGFILLGLARPGLSLTPAAEDVVAANNDFAMDLYAKIKNDPNQAGKNIFFSPFSVSSALAMLYAGARGNTKKQMGTVLKLDSVKGDIHDGFHQLFVAFNDPTNNYTLQVANAMYGSQNYTFLQAYLTLVSQSYLSQLKTMNFAGNPEACRMDINKWVAAHTNQKIKELLPKLSITADTVFVLANAIYFKGLWDNQFDKADTTVEDFRVSATETMKANMMNLKETILRYSEVSDLDCKIIELPYVRREVSMFILLPNKATGLSDLESNLTAASFGDALASMCTAGVEVSIPKFQMSLDLDLGNLLTAMGMTDVFTSAADLSGVDGGVSLYVTGAFHKAFINVDEAGTEAAAATAVEIGCEIVPKGKIFKADHPFFFVIYEKTTGSIIFSGRVVTPPQAATGSTGSEPAWCDPLPHWLCELLKWLGILPQKRQT